MNGSEQELLSRAARLRQQGSTDEAKRLLEQVVADNSSHGAALNSLGLIALEQREYGRAVELFSRVATLEPSAIPIWLNLSEAHAAAGDPASSLAALDRALAVDAYCVPALVKKAQTFERLGDGGSSARVYRALMSMLPDRSKLPDPLRAALERGDGVVRAEAERSAEGMREPLDQVSSQFPDADLARARGYAEHRAGIRKVYQQQPTGPHFPYLPALEFFDRSLFHWFEELEAATPAIREELLALWTEQDEAFRPFVAFEPTAPVNQWGELNHSRRWSAWFFWDNGVRFDANCARCPKASAILDQLPLLQLPGKAPTAMFSVLEPHTRIPPHTGTTNIRSTVHLPLVVPPGCGFRVGSETRQWREGEAWAFDDTIEHEAWNDSDEPRAVLIIDVWNPLLTEAERAVVRAVG